MIELKICETKNKEILIRLIQFYYYDLDASSDLAHVKLKNGKYEDMPYFDNYWFEKQRFPYLVFYNTPPIGFVLIHNISVNINLKWKLAEFFIMRPFRRHGIASNVFRTIINNHKGAWEISVLKDNSPALKFWEKELRGAIKCYHGQFPEYAFYELDG